MKHLLIILTIAAFTQTAVAQTVFPYPDIPDTLATNDDRMAYFLEHYWDKYDFADTTLVDRCEIAELGFALFIENLSALDATEKVECIDRFAKGAFGKTAHGKVSEWFEATTEHYLADANSPMRNEDCYILFLYAQMKTLTDNGADATRPKARLATALKNRPGTVAADFSFTTRTVAADFKSAETDSKSAETDLKTTKTDLKSSETEELKSSETKQRSTLLETEAPTLLLIFYDPACTHCGETLSVLCADNAFRQQVADGKLKVLAVYTEGDRALWEKTCNELPSEWIVAIDESGIVENNIYDIPAMPVFYLLDSDKRVILKDPFVTALLEYLKQ